MIGLMLHTLHTSPMPCDSTPGIYISHNDFAGGILKNSECKTGAWGAWAPETNVLTISKVNVKAGLVLGVITGYSRGNILPLLSPSVAVSVDKEYWLRFNILPKANKDGAGGVMLSIEKSF